MCMVATMGIGESVERRIVNRAHDCQHSRSACPSAISEGIIRHWYDDCHALHAIPLPRIAPLLLANSAPCPPPRPRWLRQEGRSDVPGTRIALPRVGWEN